MKQAILRKRVLTDFLQLNMKQKNLCKSCYDIAGCARVYQTFFLSLDNASTALLLLYTYHAFALHI